MKTSESHTTATTATATMVQKKKSSFFSQGKKGGFFGNARGEGAFFPEASGHSDVVQRKLTVGRPNDVYEKEADHMAHRVVRRLRDPASPMSEPVRQAAEPVQRMTKAPAESGGGHLQEKCAECEKEEIREKEVHEDELKKKPIFESNAEPQDDEVQRKCAACEKEERLQRKATGDSGEASPSLEHRLSASKSGGSPLPDGVRAPMEGAFGADFSKVRIHSGSDAQQMSSELGAKAFTTGKHIYFGAGQLNPAQSEGKSLLAHELTHTIQQGASERSSKVQRQPESGNISNTGGKEGVVQRGLLDSIASGVGAAWDATGGKLVNAAGEVITMGEDFFWSLLEKAAPGIAGTIRKISQVGIVEFLKDEVKGAVSHLFDGLTNGTGFFAQISPQFASLLKQAKVIVTALASGDCKPLFAALEQLKETLTTMAGDAWQKITDFFAPVGEFFEGVWNSIGAPFVDWIKKTAGSVWDKITAIGKNLWDMTAPVRNALAKAWDWVKGKLGFNYEDTGEEGLIQWVEKKASEAWDALKAEMEPIIAPMRAMVGYVRQFIPLEAILNLRKTIDGWLDKAAAMGDAMGADGKGVGAQAQQISLRDQILPAILQFIQRVRLRLIDAGGWVANKIGSIGSSVLSFFGSLSSIPLVSALSGVIGWLRDEVASVVRWAQGTVQKLFTALGDALVYLSKFVRPILDLLTKIVGVLGDLLGKLPDLILGPVWWVLPQCIKDPIKDFFLDQILSRMPFFKKLQGLKDIWTKLEDAALLALKQVFVDGNLAGAVWTFFSTMLDILNIPPKLIAGIIKKGATVFKEILNAPLDFLVNFLHALKGGFSRFFDNIWTHLLSGLTTWLTGQLQGTGIQVPKDFTLKEIFKFVCSLLDITVDKILTKIEIATGKKGLKAKLQKAIAIGSKALGWLVDLFKDGPAGVWPNLAQQIGNLWDMILNGVAGWIEKTLIGQAIKWVAEKLDPTGIMPVITSIIDFFNVVAGIANQARQILEIIDHTIDGIEDVIKGIIDKAAVFIEGVLAGAIPVVMTLLGYLFGVSDVGEEVKEVVTSLREKVDAGIDWLIKQGMDLFNSLFGAAAGEDKPGDADAALAEIDKEGNEKASDGDISSTEANQIAEDVKRDFPEAFQSITVKDGGETWNYDYVQKAADEKKIPKKRRPILSKESAPAPKNPGKSTIVVPLTAKVQQGETRTTDKVDGWDHARLLNMAKSPEDQGAGGDWIRGHIVSYRFGGDGMNTDNLMIIDRSANGNMGIGETKADKFLHDLIKLDDPKKPEYNKVMYYKVEWSSYGGKFPTFGNSITVSWGVANEDGSSPKEEDSKDAQSQRPPDDPGTVRYNINSTGAATFATVGKSFGIIPSFSQNLMRIRNIVGQYPKNKAKIEDLVMSNHDTHISDDTTEEQLEILMDNIDSELNLTIK
jgi:Domain of unknown function (DUF4157)